MQVANWGYSLAVRLPAGVDDTLDRRKETTSKFSNTFQRSIGNEKANRRRTNRAPAEISGTTTC